MRTRVPRRAAEPRLQQVPVRDLLRDDDLARHVAAAGVELLQRRGEHRLGLGQAVEEKPLPRHHLAVAHAEGLHRRPLALDVRGEEVPLLDVGRGDLLRRLQPQQGLDLVAQRGRLLVALGGRGTLHLLAQAPGHFLGAPLQEEPRVLARAPVAVDRADLGDARRGAALDLVLQAGAGALPVQRLLARADAEELADEPGRLPPEARGDVGPPVGVVVLGRAADHVEPGVLLRHRELEVRVVLVVAQPHVVGRLVALDQVVLERQGLHLAVGDHEVEVGDLLDHAALVELGRTRGLEVRADAVAKDARLAHVEDRSVRPLEQVDARAARELLELVGERHPASPAGSGAARGSSGAGARRAPPRAAPRAASRAGPRAARSPPR